MLELQEYLELKSLTDQNKFNNLISELNVDFLILEKLVMSISLTLLNVKLQQLAPLSWEEPQRMFWTKWKEIFMTA